MNWLVLLPLEWLARLLALGCLSIVAFAFRLGADSGDIGLVRLVVTFFVMVDAGPSRADGLDDTLILPSYLR